MKVFTYSTYALMISLLMVHLQSHLVQSRLTSPTLSSMALGGIRKAEEASPGVGQAQNDGGGAAQAAKPERKRGILSLRPIVKKCLSFLIADKDMLSILSTVLSGTTWIFIFMSVVGTMGIDTKPLVSLVTVSGFTIGLAAKDILTSTIAAAYMISMRAFKRDMIISIGEHKGRVRSFDTNFVKLITNDGRLILIPMASVYGKSITIHGGTHE